MHVELYVRLGFEDNTPTSKEIKSAYRSKTKECHPDIFPGNKEKEALFLSITEAYEILMDEAKREKYDKYGFIMNNNEETLMRDMAINNIINSYISAVDMMAENQIDTVDIKELLMMNIGANETNLSTEIKKRENSIKNIKRSLEKFKYKGSDDNVLHIATLKVIAIKNEELAEISKARSILEIMRDILNNYDYETINIMQTNNTVNTYGGFTIRFV